MKSGRFLLYPVMAIAGVMTAIAALADITREEMVGRYQRADTMLGLPALNARIFPHWIEGSDHFWYVRQTPNGHQYRLVDAEKASNRVAFDHQKLAAALSRASGENVDASALPLESPNEAAAATVITVKPRRVTFRAFGDVWQYDDDSGKLSKSNQRLPIYAFATSKPSDKPESWLVSPDGKRAAFARDNNIWLRDLKTGEERALTHDGEEYFAYGHGGHGWGADFANAMGQIQGRWSPDGKKLYTLQRDLRQIKPSPIVHYLPADGSARPQIEWRRFAISSDRHIGEKRLVAINVDNGQIVEPHYPRLTYAYADGFGFFDNQLAWWNRDSKHAYFIEQQRGDKLARLVEFDTDTGATRELFSETIDTFFKFSLGGETAYTLRPLPETDELVWFSERNGWGHLYLYDLKTGKMKNPVTQGDWLVFDVLHVDARRRELFLLVSGRVEGRNPYYKEVVRVNMDSGKLTTLASSNHEYFVSYREGAMMPLPTRDQGVAPSGNYFVATRSRIDDMPQSLLYDRDGNPVMTLETADASRLPDGWTWPEPVKMVAADGKTDIYGAIFRPSNFDPQKKYPVLEYSVYAGPEWLVTPQAAFGASYFPGDLTYKEVAAYAELGFIVVTIDGRGQPFRGRAFQRSSYGWEPANSNVDDRVAGIRQLARRYPYMDLDRVGITGHRGATQVLYSMLDYPDFYKTGVLPQPHDTLVMPAIWGERFEGTGFDPRQDPRHYSHNLHKLKGKLLLWHTIGGIWNPVAGAFRLIDAMKQANRDFDMIIMDNQQGMPTGYLGRRIWDWQVRNLMGEEPPEEFKRSH